jgi:hypothetical protein
MLGMTHRQDRITLLLLLLLSLPFFAERITGG